MCLLDENDGRHRLFPLLRRPIVSVILVVHDAAQQLGGVLLQLVIALVAPTREDAQTLERKLGHVVSFEEALFLRLAQIENFAERVRGNLAKAERETHALWMLGVGGLTAGKMIEGRV